MEIDIRTNKRTELIDVTDRVQKLVDIDSGLLVAFVTHTTAGIYINENESGLRDDVLAMLNRLVPEQSYKHDLIDNNADSHLKALLVGNSAVIPVEKKRLHLGTWQRLFFCEFDGPRSRRLHFTLIPSQ